MIGPEALLISLTEAVVQHVDILNRLLNAADRAFLEIANSALRQAGTSTRDMHSQINKSYRLASAAY